MQRLVLIKNPPSLNSLFLKMQNKRPELYLRKYCAACVQFLCDFVFPAQVVYETSASVTMTEPYIAGFLAFREVDFLLERLSVVRSQRPDIVPQVHY